MAVATSVPLGLKVVALLSQLVQPSSVVAKTVILVILVRKGLREGVEDRWLLKNDRLYDCRISRRGAPSTRHWQVVSNAKTRKPRFIFVCWVVGSE